MDWDKDDELDFEEDDAGNDLLEAQSKTSDNSTLTWLDDQYLQLDCDEEENLFPNTEIVDNVSAENQNPTTETQNEEDENHTEPNETTKSETKDNPTENNEEKLTKQPEINQLSNLANLNVSSNPNDSSLCKAQKTFRIPKLSHSNQQPNQNCDFQQNKVPLFFYNNPKSNLQPLMGINIPFNNTPNSFPPAIMGSRKKPRRWKKQFSHHFFGHFNKNRCKFQTMNGNTPHLSGEGDNSWRFCNGNYKRRNFQNRVDTNSGEFFRYNSNSFVDVQYKLINDDEKELVTLKKEARLKRFSNDGMIGKDKMSVNSTLDDKHEKCLLLEEDYFKKMEKQKLIREKFLRLKGERRKESTHDTDPYDLLKRPTTYKASLLKKRNPFEEDSKPLQLIPESQIKQEGEIKKEKIEDESTTVVKTDQPPIKIEGNSSTNSPSQNFTVVKSETKSSVKFVRTISKCFDELAFKKPKAEFFPFNVNNNQVPFPSLVQIIPPVGQNSVNSLVTSIPSQQIESQLTGCIVKVLNIPPSTTTNDVLALCCSVGTVREVKLNFPKENSVVIRFVDPSSAEKFFSLYHGQKMNNYFLNVIIV